MEYSLVIHVSNYECYSQDSRDTKRHQVEQWYHSQCRIVSQMSYRGFLLLKILFDLAWVPLLPSVMDFKAFPTVSTNSRSLLSYVSLWFCVPGCLRIVTLFHQWHSFFICSVNNLHIEYFMILVDITITLLGGDFLK